MDAGGIPEQSRSVDRDAHVVQVDRLGSEEVRTIVMVLAFSHLLPGYEAHRRGGQVYYSKGQ